MNWIPTEKLIEQILIIRIASVLCRILMQNFKREGCNKNVPSFCGILSQMRRCPDKMRNFVVYLFRI